MSPRRIGTGRSTTTMLVGLAVLLVATGCGSERRVEMDRRYPGLAPEDQYLTDLQLRSGLRLMQNDDWEGLDEQFTLGLAWTARREAWPLSVAGSVDVHSADAEDDAGDEWESRTWEFGLGVHRTEVVAGGLMLSTGLGGSYHRVILDGPAGFHDLDWAVGAYAQGGVGYLLGGWGLLGVVGRYGMTTDVEFRRASDPLDLDSAQAMGVLGVRF